MTVDPAIPAPTAGGDTSAVPARDTSAVPAGGATMSVLAATGYGTAEVLEWAEVPVPTPAADQVLVEVAASSLNALDWHFLTGTPYFLRLMAGLRRPKRTIPGADMAGVVVAVGADVTDLAPGDRVYGETNGGGCAPYLATTATTVVPIADHVTFEAAAATPVAGLTAIQGLRTHAEVKPGERVLINGAAGGVGTFAVQIAKAMGAEVTAVCSTRNVAMVEALGADEVIDYTTDDFVAGGRRFDVMLDNVGSRTPKENLSVLTPGARFVAISGPKGNPWIDPMGYVLKMALATWRSDASFHQFTASPNREDLAALAEMLADGRIVPAIDRVVGLDGLVDGMVEIGSGHARSKIVIHPR